MWEKGIWTVDVSIGNTRKHTFEREKHMLNVCDSGFYICACMHDDLSYFWYIHDGLNQWTFLWLYMCVCWYNLFLNLFFFFWKYGVWKSYTLEKKNNNNKGDILLFLTAETNIYHFIKRHLLECLDAHMQTNMHLVEIIAYIPICLWVWFCFLVFPKQ